MRIFPSLWKLGCYGKNNITRTTGLVKISFKDNLLKVKWSQRVRQKTKWEDKVPDDELGVFEAD